MLAKYHPKTNFPAVGSGSRFVERILTSASGQQFKVLFLVSLVNGEFKGEIISAVPIDAQPVVFLAPLLVPIVADTQYVFPYAPAVSPFSELFFFNSQPTRAPSF